MAERWCAFRVALSLVLFVLKGCSRSDSGQYLSGPLLYFCNGVEHCYLRGSFRGRLADLSVFHHQSLSKLDNGIPFHLLLLLSGDIEVCPGPSASFPCHLEVSDSDKALCCDSCNQWIHVACDIGIDEATYDDMVAHPSTVMWYCTSCSHFEPPVNSSVNVSNPPSLKCIVMNVRSICAKKLDLFAYLAAYPYDIVAITETFLDSSIEDVEFAPHSYSVFRRDRNRHGGGVMMLVRDHIPVTRRLDLETDCEILWLQLAARGCEAFLFGVYYRPPGNSVEALEHLSNLCSCNLPLVICGDFNVPNIDWSTVAPISSTRPAEILCGIVADNSLTQLVDSPTRGDNILDLILSNRDCVSLVNMTDNLPFTDHLAIEFSVSITIPVQSRCQRTLYNYKKADFNAFREMLSHIPWDVVSDSDDVEYSWCLWKDLFFFRCKRVYSYYKVEAEKNEILV